MKRHSGFTLIEVLVALVIVGMALPALLLRMQSIIDHTGHMNAKTYAYWFAENKRQELMLMQQLEGGVTKTRKRQDSEEFAGREWHWKVEISPFKGAEIPNLYQMEISVGLAPDNYIATLEGVVYE